MLGHKFIGVRPKNDKIETITFIDSAKIGKVARFYPQYLSFWQYFQLKILSNCHWTAASALQKEI